MNISERLYNYCEKIKNGEIKASKKHIWAVERFMNDLKKSENDDYPFYFDPEIVEDFYLWAKNFKHTKGMLAGEPIELQDFQLFIVSNIFGWKKKRNGYRRFRKSYIQLSRKQAKSQLLALIASYEAFLSGEQGEIYISGWQKETSDIVYNEILSQIKNADILKGAFSDSYHRITTKKTGSIIKALSREARRFGDGTNPSFCVIDEYHNHIDDSIYSVLNSGMVSRPNGHICIITTAGFDLNRPCYSEYQYLSKILDPENPVENDDYFALICELDSDDDIEDESNWIKANPLQATIPEGMDFLRSELKTAKDQPEKMRGFLVKNLNKWIQSRESGYMPLDKWNACGDDSLSLEDMRGMECIAGIDLSAKLDLTSISLLFKKDDDVIVFNHNFIPEDRLEEKRKSDKKEYDVWVNCGWITATPGSVVDYRYLEKYIVDIEKEYDLKIKEICADPWNSTHFLNNMQTLGYITIETRQGIQTMAPSAKDFRERVFAKRVKHDNNPVMAWSIGNAITRTDHNENFMLDKAKSTERIDPIVSALIAHTRTDALDTLIDMSEHVLSDDFSF